MVPPPPRAATRAEICMAATTFCGCNCLKPTRPFPWEKRTPKKLRFFLQKKLTSRTLEERVLRLRTGGQEGQQEDDGGGRHRGQGDRVEAAASAAAAPSGGDGGGGGKDRLVLSSNSVGETKGGMSRLIFGTYVVLEYVCIAMFCGFFSHLLQAEL